MAQQTALALINGLVAEIPATDTIRGAGGGGTAAISELYADPTTPAAQSAWVLATQVATVGSPVGLLLTLTQASTSYSYALKYRTLEGTTISTPLA